MVRLDRTIGVPKIALTGVIVPMVRSSQTMTDHLPCRLIDNTMIALMGLDPVTYRGISPSRMTRPGGGLQLSAASTARRNSGKASAWNHGFLRSHAVVRHDGCGNGKNRGRWSRKAATRSLIGPFPRTWVNA